MKLQFLLVFGLVSSLSFGQETKLPVLSPQSPTTASLGKYGEVQVNESSGTISPSIPLFEYNAGKINIPIALSYSGNGVRVNQDPTWVGINWNLNPSGVITREVRDEIDELTPLDKRMYLSAQTLDSLPEAKKLRDAPSGGTAAQLDPNTVWAKTLCILASENNDIDTEVDIFNYSFLGYSGSFYLDKNNKVHLIKYDKELSITFDFAVDNKSYFMIKTPEGDIYFFGGPNASESSKTWAIIGAGSRVESDYAQNAFYLNKISFLTGGDVNFEYDQYLSNDCSNRIGLQESATLRTINTCNKTALVIYSEVQSLIKLNRITNTINNQIVDFDTTTLNECAGIYQLNNILLKTSNTGIETILKKIRLNYFTVYKEIISSKNKFFLDKVEFFDKNNHFEYDYELKYYSPELLPKKDSFAQDELGNYNGKNNNATLVPNVDHFNTVCGALADREAFLDYAQYGALSQITYPTGGYSTFVYELPYKGQKQVFTNHRFFANYGSPGSGITSSHICEASSDATIVIHCANYFLDGVDQTLDVTTSVTITARLEANVTGSISHQGSVALYAIKTDPYQTEEKILIVGYGFPDNLTNSATRSYSQQSSKTLSAGNYSFRIEIKRPNGQTGCSIMTSAVLGLPAFFRDVSNPGLRIKRVVNYDNNSSPQTTRYYYNTIDKINIESCVFNPNYTNAHFLPSDPSVSTSGLIKIQTLNGNSVSNFRMCSTDMYVYENVTISYGGDAFQNGGKGMHFSHYGDRSPDIYDLQNPTVLDGSDFNNYVNVGTNELSYYRSVLTHEFYYNKTSINPIKEVTYNYFGSVNKVAHNIKIYHSTPREGNPLVGDYVYLLYRIKSFKYRLLSTTTKEYFAGVTNPLETTTTQTFATDKVSLPSTIETTNSNNETEKTKIYYPSDIATIGNLTDEDVTMIPLLTTKHNLAEIIKTESFVNNELLESKQVSFKNWSGKILPSIIKTKKGNNAATSFEDRVIFHNYNSLGKPTLVSLKDGMKIQYVYNSKQQVILKIENLDSTMTIDDGINSSSPCFYQDTYPDAMITSYTYDNDTNNLTSITDPKCDKITYTYDSYGRLLHVKDKDNNILNENKSNYKQ